MSGRMSLLQIARGGPDDNEWYWHFSASNGLIIARSSETYRRKAGCIHGAALTLGVPDELIYDGASIARLDGPAVKVRVLS